MTAPDPRLGEIETRLSADVADFDEGGYAGDGQCMTDRAYLLAELRAAREALLRVEAVVAEWEDLAGSGSDWERVYGKQKVSVEFAVSRIRAAVAAADGGGEQLCRRKCDCVNAPEGSPDCRYCDYKESE